MNPVVAITRCTDYEHVESAIESCLDHLGGMSAFVRPGDRTLLKVNLVSNHDEKDAVTTHSAVVSAVINEVRKAGGIPHVGDSPALASADAIARRSGIKKVCEDSDVPLVELDEPVIVTNPDARLVRAFRISKKLRQFDVIVNLPKLKTHHFTGMTGAVKNLFGCIPGKLKTAQHLVQQDPVSFSEMLLDLHDTIRPALTIVDAVVGMEGPGPGSGYPRNFGLIIAGTNALSVDVVCAQILGFTDREVPIIGLAKKRDVSNAHLDRIRVLGERIGDVAVHDLKKPGGSFVNVLPRFVMNLGKRTLVPRPILLADRCTGCSNCASICAAGAIAMNKHLPRFDHDRCIRCYCCHEICPSRAIALKGSFLSKLFDSKAS